MLQESGESHRGDPVFHLPLQPHERCSITSITLPGFQGYIAANKPFIPNYGDRYRHGETISTAFAESTVNQVVSRRMVKQHQMRWTPRGAHLLLQVRTQALNDDLRATFGRWYPGMQRGMHQEQEAA
jgi:hypothetical protein